MSTASLVTVPSGRPTVSFELYPPRTPARTAAAWETVERLAAAAPDVVSADDQERPRVGIDATVSLGDDVVAAAEASGLHLHTFNQHRPALDVVERLRRPLTATTTRTPR